MRKTSKSSLTTQYMVLLGVLLLVANIVLGLLLLRQSSAMMQSLIRKSMLNVSGTAAELIDGDAIGALTEDDVGSPAYNAILHTLSVFQQNADIRYIYAVRQTGEDTFVFTVDPDPIAPGAFGEEILVTSALLQAGRGIASVDDKPAADRWGNFYSSFSPVFDSQGKVAGIIGVDFDSAWFNEQNWKNTSFVILFSILFTLVGLAAVLLINARVHKRFDDLGAELAALSNDVEALTEEIVSNTGHPENEADASRPLPKGGSGARDGDELLILSRRIHDMHKEMERYLDYMRAQVNTDALTRIGNSSAYLERQKALEAKILDGSAFFLVVVFDINDLKHVNDRYGHACGDRIIRAAASVIAVVFGQANAYRIGGDEFIAIVEQTTEDELTARLAGIEESIAAFNQENTEYQATLSVSSGFASYIPGQDHSFRDVFIRADKQMYDRKDSYHRRNASRIS